MFNFLIILYQRKLWMYTKEKSTLLASVCSIFQQNFDPVYFWYL
jgi:hypothetical protein